MGDFLGSLVQESQKWTILCVIGVGCYNRNHQHTPGWFDLLVDTLGIVGIAVAQSPVVKIVL